VQEQTPAGLRLGEIQRRGELRRAGSGVGRGERMADKAIKGSSVQVGMKTDRIRTDITDIVFVFIFMFGFGFEYG
jgi:hypothetical protein